MIVQNVPQQHFIGFERDFTCQESIKVKPQDILYRITDIKSEKNIHIENYNIVYTPTYISLIKCFF